MEPTDASEQVDCAVIVVTYNNERDIARLVESLHASADGLSLRVVVVDNGSVDGTTKVVQGLSGVVCVETGTNLGYAGAINVGRRHAGRCASLFIVNPDLWLEPGALRRLHAVLADPLVGVAVPLLLNDQGHRYPSIRREPSITRALGDALLGDSFRGRPSWLSDIVWDDNSYRHRHAVDWASGAAMLVSAACNGAVGPWDAERFFLYSEETDFAARTRDFGLRIEYVPDARAHHREGGSGRSADLVGLLAVNRIRYYNKRHGRAASGLFRAVVALHELARATRPEHRRALRTVLRRSRWTSLPGNR
jgi:GT2 family glycosyltransferase